MELWIRSQDKEDLVKVENIRCWYETQIAVNVKTFFNNVDYVVVGEYETKERALEVLDEIQEFIENRGNVKITQDINGITSEVEDAKRVYEIPKE